MRSSDLEVATSYFDRFVEAFATFDGEQIASLFTAPVVGLQSNGSLVGLPDRSGVVRYYQAALDKYHADGCRSCRWTELSVTPMGRASLLATATWDLLREDGAVVRSWRQSYCLSLFGAEGPRAFSTISHACSHQV